MSIDSGSPGSSEMKKVTRRKEIIFPSEERQDIGGSGAIANALKENSEISRNQVEGEVV